ncbi:MAG: ribonuclease D [Mariprofundales bacterium]
MPHNTDLVHKQYYVDTTDTLQEACHHLQSATHIAIDTEFHREHTYYPRFALLQLATDSHCFVIDPLALAANDMQTLWDVVCDNNSLKVFHAARQDIELILHVCDKLPLPFFDTQMAAAFLGYGDQIGLANLSQRVLHQTLPKQESYTDWISRPLTEQQIDYAANDVIYLLPMYRLMKAELEKLGRLSWLDEEMQAAFQRSTYIIEPDLAWQRIRGSQRLRKPMQLASLRNIALWRELCARQRNVPRKRILSDEDVLHLAQRQQLNIATLQRMRGISKRVIKDYADNIITAWQQGRDLSPELMPKPEKVTQNSSPSSGTNLRMQLLHTVVRLKADSENIAVGLLACKKELATLAVWARNPETQVPDVRCLQGWRHQLVGKDILRILRGELCLRLDKNTHLPVTAAVNCQLNDGLSCSEQSIEEPIAHE